MVWKNIGQSSWAIKSPYSRERVSTRRVTRIRGKSQHLKEHGLPLHFAICNKLSSEIRCLIEQGCDVDSRDQYKRTPLMLCCIDNDEDWSAGVVMMLLQAGANASFRDENGRNALMFSAIFSRPKITDLLLSSIDYDIFQRDENDRTAIHYALMQGNEKIIRSISEAFQGERKASIIDFIQRTTAVLRRRSFMPKVIKSIMKTEAANNNSHRPTSDMNVHQFRRCTMRKFRLRAHMMEKLDPYDATGSIFSSQIASFNELQPTNSVLHRRGKYPLSVTHSLPELTFDSNDESRQSWKSSVPAIWKILAIQCSPSYRRSAKTSGQTYEEALGLPPIEQDGADGVLDAETSSTSSGQSPPRRSSMPVSSSTPQTTVSSRATRRRSEANIVFSAGSSSKGLPSERKVTKRSETLSELRRAKEALDSQVHIGSTNKTNIDGDGNLLEIPVDEATSPLLSSKPKSEGAVSKRSNRTTITRNRPGSALRQQLPLSPNVDQADPAVASPVAKANTVQEAQESTARSTNVQGAGPTKTTTVPQLNTTLPESTDIHETRSENIDETLADQTSGKQKNENAFSRRTPRRGSILMRERVLADIVEENEIAIGSVTPERFRMNSRSNSSVIRCASAYIRGKTASVRRNTR